MNFLALPHTKQKTNTAWKVSKYGVISGPYFPVFGLNTEIYEVNLRIQSEYRNKRTRNNSVFGHFSRRVNVRILKVQVSKSFSVYSSFSDKIKMYSK